MKPLMLAVNNETLEPVNKDVAIVPASSTHVRELARTMRAGDRREIEIYGVSPDHGLWVSFKHGLNNKTALIDGQVAAMWGTIGTYLGEVGCPWLITSEAIHKISPLRFAREYQREVYEMLGMFDRLENWVDAEYEGAIRLLSIVGFTIGDPVPVKHGHYRKFSMERAY